MDPANTASFSHSYRSYRTSEYVKLCHSSYGFLTFEYRMSWPRALETVLVQLLWARWCAAANAASPASDFKAPFRPASLRKQA